MSRQGSGGPGDPIAHTLMTDAQQAANSAETRASQVQLGRLLTQRHLIAMEFAVNGEVAATGSTAIALRFGMVQAALDDTSGLLAGGACWIAYEFMVALLS